MSSSTQKERAGDDREETGESQITELRKLVEALQISARAQQEKIDALESERPKGAKTARASPTIAVSESAPHTTPKAPEDWEKRRATPLQLTPRRPPVPMWDDSGRWSALARSPAVTPAVKTDLTMRDAPEPSPGLFQYTEPEEGHEETVRDGLFESYRLKMPKEHLLRGGSNWLAWSMRPLLHPSLRTA
ncbi:hypothetical protein CMUS01_13515 [Colletotrichum musicola]|uniref:Uncharacterized protein n=1 Tax=Colletotrichum musicola TaxID=2175873 RepID=A0A8H6JCU4_9PEZI|nr:hypothetical protein CMUS01_13515 [Colletotrichum musicola]